MQETEAQAAAMEAAAPQMAAKAEALAQELQDAEQARDWMGTLVLLDNATSVCANIGTALLHHRKVCR